MNALKFFRTTYLCYFSKPAADRTIYRLARQHRWRSIVQVGLGNLLRTRRLLEMATLRMPIDELKFAGVDLFESGSDPEAVGLKAAHRQLRPLCGKLQLLPGDPFSALARSANALTKTDLLLIGAGVDGDSLAKAWFYVPRMLHDDSCVLMEEPAAEGSAFRRLTRLEIEQRASASARSMRRAA